MDKFNILFTSSGRRFALIKHFKEVLKKMNIEGEIITSDVKSTSPAAFISDFHELVPLVSNVRYISTLKEICLKYEINLLIPLIDTELCLLAQHKYEFEKIGVTVLISSPKINEICFDKVKTSKFFRENGINSPMEYEIENILLDDSPSFPYLIKPAKGSSSLGVFKVNNKSELEFFKNYISEPILQEYLEGDEYTIDALVDLDGQFITAVPRLRIETRAGEVSKGLTVKNELLINATKEVLRKMPGVLGCITLQCFYTSDGTIKFIEINPRFGGGFPLSIAAGADFPKYLIEKLTNKTPTTNLTNWKSDLMMLRYDDAIFISREKVL